MKPFVYLWRDSLYKKYYIGYHSGWNKNYVCSSSRMMAEYKARPQDFQRRILKTGSKTEMAVLERKLLQSRKDHLGERYYNLTIPMENRFPILELTDEIRQKMKGPRPGFVPWMKGKRHKPESLLKLSRSKKGKKIGVAGRAKHLSEEHKKNIANGMKGRKLSAEHKKRIGEANRRAYLAKIS